jgi:hypothetical protein
MEKGKDSQKLSKLLSLGVIGYWKFLLGHETRKGNHIFSGRFSERRGKPSFRGCDLSLSE